jgi:ectoine hydroxylase-related dioxygenase (phytanoyl-CoA dioxygenase family)
MSEALRAEYQRLGYVSGIAIADPAEADHYRQQFNALEAEVGQEKARIGLVDYHFQTEFIWRLATHRKILEAVNALIGENFHLLATHFFCKYGQEEKFVAWHQDVTYWGLEPPEALTVWYAVDDSDRENGCMRVLPGTHAGGIRTHGKAAQAGNLLSINQEVPVTPEEEASAVDLELKAGEISIHEGALIHGSLPNRSTRRRCGLTLRYIPTYVQQVALHSGKGRYRPILVHGEDREQNFERLHPPFS